MSTVNLFEDAVLLDLTFHAPGIRRKANKENIETEADKDMLGLSKAILDSNEYRAVKAIATNCRKWVEARSGESILKRGTYMIKLSVLDAVYAHVEQATADYMEAVERFMEVYPEQQEAARLRLKDQYDAANYPEPFKLRKAFHVSKRVVDISPPGSDKVSHALRAKELKQWREDMAEAGEEIRKTLRTSARELLVAFKERLSFGDTLEGKKTRWHPAAFNNLLEFVDLFYHRDLTNDIDMQNIMGKCKQVLLDTDAETLHSDEAVREAVEGETAAIIAKLDTLLEEQPSRMFFDEEVSDAGELAAIV